METEKDCRIYPALNTRTNLKTICDTFIHIIYHPLHDRVLKLMVSIVCICISFCITHFVLIQTFQLSTLPPLHWLFEYDWKATYWRSDLRYDYKGQGKWKPYSYEALNCGRDGEKEPKHKFPLIKKCRNWQGRSSLSFKLKYSTFVKSTWQTTSVRSPCINGFHTESYVQHPLR